MLEMGADHARENGIPIDDIAGWKLAEDMLPLSFQVQTASNTAKNSLPRVAGTEAVPMEDNERTVAELQKRITKIVELLKAVEAVKFAGKETDQVLMKAGPKELEFTAKTYITCFALLLFSY
ncbi:uncharacterized protein N7473_008931 [Penicillium subrubescens]|nr:uncharacterized protein N7473_008931 [Penicillium subrubescens]KAJ5886257.1 hypothetical protein N7473_008931 [Penicillium subrubescens]